MGPTGAVAFAVGLDSGTLLRASVEVNPVLYATARSWCSPAVQSPRLQFRGDELPYDIVVRIGCADQPGICLVEIEGPRGPGTPALDSLRRAPIALDPRAGRRSRAAAARRAAGSLRARPARSLVSAAHSRIRPRAGRIDPGPGIAAHPRGRRRGRLPRRSAAAGGAGADSRRE